MRIESGVGLLDELPIEPLLAATSFELRAAAATPDAFIQALRDEAGLFVTREPQQTPTLVVRRRG